MDQNVLFVTLLRQSCIKADYRYGVTAMIPAEMVANLIGVENNATLIARELGNLNLIKQLLQHVMSITAQGFSHKLLVLAVYQKVSLMMIKPIF
ncbi:hypothetical protein [Xenorhabdus cabanillasii]|uniref:hypothetical protein n=1 Tax=Xenorhabdus cabanillasii TaxID=351673 RepID=UPI002B40BB06|nr:hypothetical protein [Xenorhabdus sp. Flor]